MIYVGMYCDMLTSLIDLLCYHTRSVFYVFHIVNKGVLIMTH